LFKNYYYIIVSLQQSPAAHRIHLPAGRRVSTARKAAQRIELAARQLSRFYQKKTMASKFAEYKLNGLSRVGCNVGGLAQA